MSVTVRCLCLSSGFPHTFKHCDLTDCYVIARAGIEKISRWKKVPAISSGWSELNVITPLSVGDICFSLSQVHVFVPWCQSHCFIHRKIWIPVSEGLYSKPYFMLKQGGIFVSIYLRALRVKFFFIGLIK